MVVSTDSDLKEIPSGQKLQVAGIPKEKIWATVGPYYVGRPNSSLVVVIPKAVRESLNITKGMRLLVKSDRYGRVIFEPLNEEVESDE